MQIGVGVLANAYVAKYYPDKLFHDKDGHLELKVQSAACSFVGNLREAAERLSAASINASQVCDVLMNVEEMC
jgi:hypothetical protein